MYGGVSVATVRATPRHTLPTPASLQALTPAEPGIFQTFYLVIQKIVYDS